MTNKIRKTEYRVYWTYLGKPHFQDFTELIPMMTLMERLRRYERQGTSHEHIAMSVKDANCVGEPGVDVTNKDYDWKKRRP